MKERATCPKASHGAVIVDRHGRIVSTGYNGAPPDQPQCDEVGCIEVNLNDGRAHCLRAIHADTNACWSAIMSGQSLRLMASIMYVTGHPCPRCLPTILATGIKRIIYERHGYENWDMESEEPQSISEAFDAVLEPFGQIVEPPTRSVRGSRSARPKKP